GPRVLRAPARGRGTAALPSAQPLRPARLPLDARRRVLPCPQLHLVPRPRGGDPRAGDGPVGRPVPPRAALDAARRRCPGPQPARRPAPETGPDAARAGRLARLSLRLWGARSRLAGERPSIDAARLR